MYSAKETAKRTLNGLKWYSVCVWQISPFIPLKNMFYYYWAVKPLNSVLLWYKITWRKLKRKNNVLFKYPLWRI